MTKPSMSIHTGIILLIAVTFLLGGCVTMSSGADPGPVQSTNLSVDLGQATSVTATIDARTDADLTIHDGASALLNAGLTYNESLKPDLSYNVDGVSGALKIIQPSRQNLDSRKLDNKWDLQFGTEAPIDVSATVSSGNTTLDLTQVQLTALNVDTSSGNLEASVGGNQTVLKSVDVSTASGTIGLNLDGEFAALQSLSLSESSGDIDVIAAGDFAALSNLQIKDTSGNTTLDLGGSWGRNLDATIRTSSGNVTVKLPSNVGIRVTTSVSSGHVTATGLHLENGAYVNDAYGTSPVTLSFDIHVTSGNITLRVGE